MIHGPHSVTCVKWIVHMTLQVSNAVFSILQTAKLKCRGMKQLNCGHTDLKFEPSHSVLKISPHVPRVTYRNTLTMAVCVVRCYVPTWGGIGLFAVFSEPFIQAWAENRKEVRAPPPLLETTLDCESTGDDRQVPQGAHTALYYRGKRMTLGVFEMGLKGQMTIQENDIQPKEGD